ncbi:PhnD/SsuA/transferrin family substrate-binding protein [Microbulbifer sp. MLAF003]|uniref:PhnD/SsuA/transferrin family substrate-binding protein n=1 Tax=unclassified Microbulbifer TaxID=2619833 RepID=UPI0024AD9826|nr:PhnD/SsuA/transferrin family substrate-binding protein [Microbulbifer sp. MLAF003]WHI51407.1 PhnD/SsuA/transferrin family substrate-binding protein [Microbulbifer sp. MLAF003]
MTNLNLTYYHDIPQGITPSEIRTAIKLFAEKLSLWLSENTTEKVHINVRDGMTVPEQYDDICNDHSQIALMKPVEYIFAHKKNNHIIPACAAYRPVNGKTDTYYYSQIYVNKETGIKSLSDLKKSPGKYKIAYGDRFSTSSFLIPAAHLKRLNIHPFLHFKHSIFAGGHDLAAKAVYQGEADIGAGHDTAIQILAKTFSDAEDKLIQVDREKIHTDPLAINTIALPKDISFNQIQKGCIEIAKHSDVQKALSLFWGCVHGLSPITHNCYEPIESAVDDMHLTENDILS